MEDAGKDIDGIGIDRNEGIDKAFGHKLTSGH